MVSKKIFFSIIGLKCMESLDPQGGASLDSSDEIGRINVGDH